MHIGVSVDICRSTLENHGPPTLLRTANGQSLRKSREVKVLNPSQTNYSSLLNAIAVVSLFHLISRSNIINLIIYTNIL